MYSVIIIEGPPIQDCVDSDILSSYADSILFVTASDMLRPDKIQMAIKRMQNTPATLEGIILTKVRPIYMD
jgi:Mrp family chromosome partitioning ATPase